MGLLLDIEMHLFLYFWNVIVILLCSTAVLSFLGDMLQ
jgi:hypothetical protein